MRQVFLHGRLGLILEDQVELPAGRQQGGVDDIESAVEEELGRREGREVLRGGEVNAVFQPSSPAFSVSGNGGGW